MYTIDGVRMPFSAALNFARQRGYSGSSQTLQWRLASAGVNSWNALCAERLKSGNAELTRIAKRKEIHDICVELDRRKREIASSEVTQ